jgi:hypothetical protein
LLLGKGNHFVWHAIVIEQITGDEQDVDLRRYGAFDDRLKTVVIEGAVCLALLRFAVAVTIQMHISRV